MDAGTELQQARQQAGLSREQIAEDTKIQLAQIEALETGAFDHLPGGSYLDGIVTAYAHAVGLDGRQMVQRVHAERALRASASADFVDIVPATTSVNNAEIVDSSNDWFYADDIDSFDPEPSVSADTSAVFAVPTAQPELQISRDYFSPPSAPRRSAGRFALTILVFLASAALGAYLYEASRQSAASRLADGSSAQHVDKTAGAGGTEGSAGVIGAAGGSGAGATGEPSAAGEAAARREPSAAGATGVAANAVTASSSERGVVHGATPDQRSTATAPNPPNAPEVPEAHEAPHFDLSGDWTLDTRIESSAYRDFEGLQLGYRLELQQHGSRLTGTGIKLVENGRRLGTASQTPIAIQGVVDGERLTLTFTERGLRRASGGKMILDVNDDGVLRGRFSSSAAQSAGIVEARRPGG